jgi:hypothetical protein
VLTMADSMEARACVPRSTGEYTAVPTHPQYSTESPTLTQWTHLEHGRHVRLCQRYESTPAYPLSFERCPGNAHAKQVHQVLNLGHIQPVESLGSYPLPKASDRCYCHRCLRTVRREHHLNVGHRCDGSVPNIDEPCTRFLGECHPSGVGRGKFCQGTLGGDLRMPGGVTGLNACVDKVRCWLRVLTSPWPRPQSRATINAAASSITVSVGRGGRWGVGGGC